MGGKSISARATNIKQRQKMQQQTRLGHWLISGDFMLMSRKGEKYGLRINYILGLLRFHKYLYCELLGLLDIDLTAHSYKEAV